MENTKMRKRILIFGATGYLGKFMVQSSVDMGHSTYVYTRPLNHGAHCQDNDTKIKTLQDFKAMGVTIIEGELIDHVKLVKILGHVQIVISVLAIPQLLDQLKIIRAMNGAHNIERFIPSEFGCDADRIRALPPFQALLDNKKIIRRSTEDANIPYTYIIGNVRASYFIHHFFYRDENCKKVTIYGSGASNVVWNYEKDVAAYTIRASIDSRTINKTVNCKPRKNIASQLDIVSLWEKKIGETLDKIHMLDDEIVNFTAPTLPLEISTPMAILQCIFVKGDPICVDLEEDELEASTLYSDYNYTSINELLNISIVNPPKLNMSKLI